jgi:hypothetical protein
MNSRTIEIIIGSAGEIQIDAVGFKGADCEKATAFLEEALGVVGQKIVPLHDNLGEDCRDNLGESPSSARVYIGLATISADVLRRDGAQWHLRGRAAVVSGSGGRGQRVHNSLRFGRFRCKQPRCQTAARSRRRPLYYGERSWNSLKLTSFLQVVDAGGFTPMTYATSRSDMSSGVMTEREKNPPLTSVICVQRNNQHMNVFTTDHLLVAQPSCLDAKEYPWESFFCTIVVLALLLLPMVAGFALCSIGSNDAFTLGQRDRL